MRRMQATKYDGEMPEWYEPVVATVAGLIACGRDDLVVQFLREFSPMGWQAPDEARSCLARRMAIMLLQGVGEEAVAVFARARAAEVEAQESLFTRPLGEISVSEIVADVRIATMLEEARIRTLKELLHTPQSRLAGIRGMGIVAIAEIEKACRVFLAKRKAMRTSHLGKTRL